MEYHQHNLGSRSDLPFRPMTVAVRLMSTTICQKRTSQEGRIHRTFIPAFDNLTHTDFSPEWLSPGSDKQHHRVKSVIDCVPISARIELFAIH